MSCGLRQAQGEQTPEGLVDNIHLTMRNIRGSASYWRKCCSELIAMVRTLGPPSWFLTFSCNDLHWPDMIKRYSWQIIKILIKLTSLHLK